MKFYDLLRDRGIDEDIITSISNQLDIYEDDELPEIDSDVIDDDVIPESFVFENYVISLFAPLDYLFSFLEMNYELVLDCGQLYIYEVSDIDSIPTI